MSAVHGDPPLVAGPGTFVIWRCCDHPDQPQHWHVHVFDTAGIIDLGSHPTGGRAYREAQAFLAGSSAVMGTLIKRWSETP